MYYYFLPYLILIPIWYYLYKFFNRSLKHYFPKYSKIKIVSLIISSIIMIPCFNVWGEWIVVVIYFAGLSIIIDLINILLKKYKFWQNIYKTSFLPLIVTIIILFWGFINISDIIPKEYTIKVNKKMDDDLKIVFISDLHYGVSINDEQLQKYINKINKIKPDIFLLGGDIFDERTTLKEFNSAVKILGSIKSKYGSYYVYGNHDKNEYSEKPAYNQEYLKKMLINNNINILEDTNVTFNNITIIGRKDQEGYFDIDLKTPEELTKNVNKNNLIIMLEHEPVEYNKISKTNTDLVLSGHTHDGQIFPIGLVSRLLKTSDLIYGKNKLNNLNEIVTSGMAGWGYTLRTEGKSEYVIINIEGK